jgi:hypothetical protein
MGSRLNEPTDGTEHVSMVTVAGESPAIHDNAKRSVSIRINTSDYGRIKVAARRLHAKEADIFRYLLQVGLSKLSPLLGEGLEDRAYFRALTDLGPDLAANFGVTAREFVTLIGAFTGRTAPPFDQADLELVDLAGTHPRMVQARLAEVCGGPVAEHELRSALHDYLAMKYQVRGTAS